MANTKRTWAVAKAKAKLSLVIDRALADGPQTITRSGRKAVVVVSAKEWARKTKRKGNLAEFFATSPLRGARVQIVRTKAKAREIEI
jgi:prevent-host-death family protein